MSLLHEAIQSITLLSEDPTDDLDIDLDPDVTQQDQDLDLDGSVNGDQSDLDAVATKASEDPNHQGLIRTVKNAHLVYKRESEDGTFEELWVFNISELKSDLKIRKAILAGTDIPVNQLTSPDGKQTYSIWTSGNVEFLKISGLQN